MEKASKELADLLFVVIGSEVLFKPELAAAGRMQVAQKNWRKCENAAEMQMDADGKVVKPVGDARFT